MLIAFWIAVVESRCPVGSAPKDAADRDPRGCGTGDATCSKSATSIVTGTAGLAIAKRTRVPAGSVRPNLIRTASYRWGPGRTAGLLRKGQLRKNQGYFEVRVR